MGRSGSLLPAAGPETTVRMGSVSDGSMLRSDDRDETLASRGFRFVAGIGQVREVVRLVPGPRRVSGGGRTRGFRGASRFGDHELADPFGRIDERVGRGGFRLGVRPDLGVAAHNGIGRDPGSRPGLGPLRGGRGRRFTFTRARRRCLRAGKVAVCGELVLALADAREQFRQQPASLNETLVFVGERCLKPFRSVRVVLADAASERDLIDLVLKFLRAAVDLADLGLDRRAGFLHRRRDGFELVLDLLEPAPVVALHPLEHAVLDRALLRFGSFDASAEHPAFVRQLAVPNDLFLDLLLDLLARRVRHRMPPWPSPSRVTTCRYGLGYERLCCDRFEPCALAVA